MSEAYSTEYIDQYISQLSSVEDAFNIYRETGSLEELHRLNNDPSSKLYLQKWLDFAKLPESDRALAQLKTPSFNKARLSPYADIMLHCQKQWRSTLDLIHIVFVYRGSFSCDMKGRKFTLTQGKCYMFNVNVAKKILPAGEASQLLNCLISQNYLENILLKQFDRSILFSDFLTHSFYTDSASEAFLEFDTSEKPAVRNIFAMAIIEQTDQLPLWQSMVNNLISELMVQLLRLHMAERDQQHFLQLGNHKLSDILIYIDNHCDSVTLDSVAETFHFHPSYLSKIIKNNTGLTFTNILQYTRLKQAALLLKNTQLSVTDIAHQVGYNNISYFYKLFQDKYGCTPAEYRENLA